MWFRTQSMKTFPAQEKYHWVGICKCGLMHHLPVEATLRISIWTINLHNGKYIIEFFAWPAICKKSAADTFLSKQKLTLNLRQRATLSSSLVLSIIIAFARLVAKRAVISWVDQNYGNPACDNETREMTMPPEVFLWQSGRTEIIACLVWPMVAILRKVPLWVASLIVKTWLSAHYFFLDLVSIHWRRQRYEIPS